MEASGKTIDPSVKIKQWEAKYFNGTNIQKTWFRLRSQRW